VWQTRRRIGDFEEHGQVLLNFEAKSGLIKGFAVGEDEAVLARALYSEAS
jgi:hypothetical protein